WERQWLMVLRDVARTTDERTGIATVFPRTGVGHKLPLLFTKQSPKAQLALVASWLSLPFDYVARQKIGGTSVTYFYVKQFLAIHTEVFSHDGLEFVVSRALQLVYTSHSLAAFANDIGFDGPPFPWDQEHRAILRAELDAYYAYLYGLTRDELRYILDPEDVFGEDYPSETFRVLKNNEIRRYG